jgi:hypothetical protein
VFPSPSRPRRASRLSFSKFSALFHHRTPFIVLVARPVADELYFVFSSLPFPFSHYDSILEYWHYCPRSCEYKKDPCLAPEKPGNQRPTSLSIRVLVSLLFLFFFFSARLALRRRSKPVRCRPSTGLASPFSSPSSFSFSRLRHRKTDRRKRAILFTSTSSSSHPFKVVAPHFQDSQETLKPSILGNKLPAPHISSSSHAFAFPSGRGFVISFLRTHG